MPRRKGLQEGNGRKKKKEANNGWEKNRREKKKKWFKGAAAGLGPKKEGVNLQAYKGGEEKNNGESCSKRPGGRGGKGIDRGVNAKN